MKHWSRPYRTSCLGLLAMAGTGWLLAVGPAAGHAQAQQIAPIFQDSATQAASVNQGYLGVDIIDVDAERAQSLKLKEARGAVITLIDHDAPAGQAGLRVNDVVLQLDGQAIQNAEQFRRILRDLPPGRKITLQICRAGARQSMTVELVDRKRMERSVWNKLGSTSSVPEMGFLHGDSMPSGFHLPSFGSTLKVGALVEPLTAQMAAHLGVESGLMVKEVARRSEAEKAGLRAFDVILKVGPELIATSADWDRALRANQGKPVPVTILRDKKQQTLTLQVDSKHQKGALEQPWRASPADQKLMAELGTQIDEKLAQEISDEAMAAPQAARQHAECLREQMGTLQAMSPEQAKELQRQTNELLKSMRSFRMDPKRMEKLQRQMDAFRKSFNPDAFQIDPQQMRELQQQMERFREQMEEWSARAEGRFV